MSVWQQLKDRNVVRVAAIYLAASWLVLQVADLLVDIYDLPQILLRWLGIILALGLPAVLALSWVYEWTPEGIVRESGHPMDRRRVFSRRTVSLTLFILVGLGIGIYFVGNSVDMERGDEAVTIADRPVGSLAVIPFINNSGSEENEYFVDGLSSELLNLLAGVPELQVTGRTSSFRYKNADVDPRTIGDELNVAHVLEGEVQRIGDRLRISVQLVNTLSGFQVWRQNFDRTLADVFELQDEIAALTVDGLRVTLTGATPTVPTTDPEAFDIYLNASFHYGLRTPQDYARARELVMQAIEIDDNFAPFYTLLASIYSNQVVIGELDFMAGSALAREAAEKALDIDPQFAFANSARGWYAMYFERDYANAGRFFQRALRIAPGSSAVLSNSAVYASTIGQLDRAEELTLAAMLRDPITPVVHLNYSSLLNRMGRHTESIESALKALELRPGMALAIVNLCQAYLLSEQAEKALECSGEIVGNVNQLFVRAVVNQSLGRESEVQAAIDGLMLQNLDEVALQLARIYAWRGETDDAFVWLDRRIENNGNIMGIKTDWALRSLHGDPRWDALMQRLGLTDSQVAEFRL